MLYIYAAVVADKGKGRQVIIMKAKNSQYLGQYAVGNKGIEVLFTG